MRKTKLELTQEELMNVQAGKFVASARATTVSTCATNTYSRK